MTASAADTTIHPPLAAFAGVLPGAAACAGLLGAGAVALGGDESSSMALAGALGVVLTAPLTALLLWARSPIDIRNLAPTIVFGSAARIGLSLVLALALWMLLGRAGTLAYWSAFLLASGGVLVAETALGVKTMRRADLARGASLPGVEANG